MSEPLSAEELERKLAAHLHELFTALHCRDRVAELEKERDEAQDSLDSMRSLALAEQRARHGWESRALSAEADLAAVQEAPKRYGRHLRQCAARRGSTRAGELGNRLPCDCGLADALARGGGQETKREAPEEAPQPTEEER